MHRLILVFALHAALILLLTFQFTPKALAKTRAVEHTSSSASTGPFALGGVIGDPTAITGKYWLDTDRALDFGISFFEYNYVLIYGDYLFHFPGGFGQRNKFFSELTPYIGVGGLIASFSGDYYRNGRGYWRSDSRASLGLGVRAPFGVEWRPSRVPLGAFLELIPGIALVPGTDFFMQFGVGCRYYF